MLNAQLNSLTFLKVHMWSNVGYNISEDVRSLPRVGKEEVLDRIDAHDLCRV